MNLSFNIIFNIYSVLIVIIIHFNARKLFEKDSLPDRLYLSVLYITVLMLVLDILSRFDGDGSVICIVLNRVGNFLIFLMVPVLPSLWLAYVHYHVFRDEKRTRKLLFPLCAINAVYAAALILSRSYGWFYFFDPDNVYQRGPFFLVPVFITVMLMLAAFVLVVANRGNLERRSFLSLVFVAVPPLIGTILQVRFYGISLVLNSVVFSLLIVFLNIQKHSLYTDHLTGVSNRKKLDEYLKEKVGSCSGIKSFSAILIDINDFKQINDTYGHVMGDSALATAAKLLKSCLRSCDFVARYGVDEFCVILDIANMSDLEALVCRIHHCLDSYNRSNNHLFELKFSMGYAVYDFRSQMSAEAFLKQIDGLMYEDKQACKCKSDTI